MATNSVVEWYDCILLHLMPDYLKFHLERKMLWFAILWKVGDDTRLFLVASFSGNCLADKNV